MAESEMQRIALSSGISLDVVTAGDPDSPAMLFLHGFPESHRTWRYQIDEFARDHFVVAPDQRGFARSDKPPHVDDYRPEKPVGDAIALMEHFGKERFTLVGHDWGGAISWMLALTRPDRVERLVILNAPHPYIFQKTLFDDPEQRAASQYIRAFRNPELENHIAAIGLETFFDTSFAKHADLALMADEKANYLDEWAQPGAMTAMLNWYRASSIVVPSMDEEPKRPAFLDALFPPLQMPVLVIWGVKDSALLPCQIDGLDQFVPDLTLVRVDAGHFVPWEAPDEVNRAMRDWLPA
ncbi:alpha/beta fold hydrolase [Stakelama pacifica]|uniref:Pimeloyl-ACP methyl ester carboxylesterase n=1 Tax=Stakelama pacifica TaxID=517720 RepID=A0A4R6FNM1_9SPHN|nr:alpha/beta hydrolase [Stakelama pacifica]TDN82294.1 pimeloyl-ACP methyl ester carboxylesterase [Stakelama pacifica]GGO95725.1 epoxide hydrolase [Stakelama pacifica]